VRSVEGCVVVSLSRTPAASVSPGNSCRQGAQTHFQLTLTDSGAAEIKGYHQSGKVDVPKLIRLLLSSGHLMFTFEW
jgi:hypothetical protein